MALNEMYEGLEIIHLEDFSNEVNIDVDLPAISSDSSVSKNLTIPFTNGHQKTLFADICQVCYGSSGLYRYYTNTTEVSSQPRVTSKNGRMSLTARSAGINTFNTHLHPIWTQSVPYIGLLFNFPIEHVDKRTILSFDYMPVDTPFGTGETFGVRRVFRNSNQTLPLNQTGEIIPFSNSHLPGKLEFILETGRMKVYFRNRLIGDISYTSRTLFLGDVWYRSGVAYTGGGISRATVPATYTPFTISNLAMVTVPLESPISRLGNIRVHRAQVNLLDDVPHSSTDALNGPKTDDGVFVNVDHNVNTVKFETVVVNDGEEIVGAQTCIAGTNTPTGSHLESKVLNGLEEICDTTHTLVETHLSRAVVGEFNLGTSPEDYSGVSLKVRSVEV